MNTVYTDWRQTMSNPFDMLNAMGGMGGIGNMISSFQQNMAEMKAQLATQEFSAEVAGGKVNVTVNGANQVVSIDIDEQLAGDVEMTGDLVLVATNQALQKAKAHSDEQLQTLTSGLPIPPSMLGMLGL